MMGNDDDFAGDDDGDVYYYHNCDDTNADNVDQGCEAARGGEVERGSCPG